MLISSVTTDRVTVVPVTDELRQTKAQLEGRCVEGKYNITNGVDLLHTNLSMRKLLWVNKKDSKR